MYGRVLWKRRGVILNEEETVARATSSIRHALQWTIAGWHGQHDLDTGAAVYALTQCAVCVRRHDASFRWAFDTGGALWENI